MHYDFAATNRSCSGESVDPLCYFSRLLLFNTDIVTIESTHDFSFLIQTQIKTLIINIIDINDTKKFTRNLQKPNCRVINLISN